LWGTALKRRDFSLGVAAAIALPHAVAKAPELVVGQAAPLSGVLASTGAQMVLGGRIYFQHVNANGGVHGRAIRQQVVDDGY
jgi:ABC-type branched-subunit amino acid transport system substrate-binding protein